MVTKVKSQRDRMVSSPENPWKRMDGPRSNVSGKQVCNNRSADRFNMEIMLRGILQSLVFMEKGTSSRKTKTKSTKQKKNSEANFDSRQKQKYVPERKYS